MSECTSAYGRALLLSLVGSCPIWLTALPQSANGATMRITQFLIETDCVQPGESVTLRLATSGVQCVALRHDLEHSGQRLPGWEPYDAHFQFLSSDDGVEPCPARERRIWHRDNGKQDHDPRVGVFSFCIDTTGWPDGEHQFLILASQHPTSGAATRDFSLRVRRSATNSSRRVQVHVNGRICAYAGATSPIHPGRPNRLRVTLPDHDAEYGLELIRKQPDGRECRAAGRLSRDAPEATFDLGIFAVPAQFDYEAGVVYRRGCQFRLALTDLRRNRPIEELRFYHTIEANRTHDAIKFGSTDRVDHRGWRRPGKVKPMDPPILLWLSPEVLDDSDRVLVRCCLRSPGEAVEHAASAEPIAAQLRVTEARTGKVMVELPIQVTHSTAAQDLDTSEWPIGGYRIEIRPDVPGSDDHDGPTILYRRTKRDPGKVALSPVAPWAFVRDAGRADVVVTDFRQAIGDWGAELPAESDWLLAEREGSVHLLSAGDEWDRPPVVLRPELKGWYAVFAVRERSGCYVQIGRNGSPRRLAGHRCFVGASDLTDDEVAIYPVGRRRSGLRELHFMPVTENSVQRVRNEAGNPAVPLIGVADWFDFFMLSGKRLAADQFDALLQAHAELGMRSIAWAIGRSWVEYHSSLPSTTRFPCTPLDAIDPKHRKTYAGPAHMINAHEPLRRVLGRRSAHDVTIEPWLAMQRHYGVKGYGGIFASQWFRDHPQWRRWRKGASTRSRSEVCYFFPEVRKERVDIFCEVAAKSPDGLVVGCCRQPPMLLYHPEMVAAYKKQTGVDPTEIDGREQDAYRRWIRWRADFFTETLRELKIRLEPIRAKTGCAIPVAVRLPCDGLFHNLAQGLDLESWCREGLVHRIQLHPIEDTAGGEGAHDVRPYVELGRRYNVRVFGGVNCNTFWNYPAVLSRGLSLLDAGVDGIELYESNASAALAPKWWIITLLGNADRIRAFLHRSNLDACYPIWSRHAAAGIDNHSFLYKWSVRGRGHWSL